MEQLDRITQNPEVMGGKACIRGLRVTVGMVVGQIGAGHSIEAVLADYPYLDREDVLQALRYAAWLAEEREIVCRGMRLVAWLERWLKPTPTGAARPARARSPRRWRR